MSPDRPSIDPAPLRSLVSSYAHERHCPTLVWGVVIDGRLAASGTVGGTRPETVYRIASMTKSFSAAATLQLRDDGVLRLDDPVSAHAPELAALDRFDSAPITIRDLLAMTSGLPTDDPWADRHLDLTDDRFDRIVADGPLFAHAAGNSFEYSNFGYAILGRVVARATGRRLQDLVSERLLRPLGLRSTTWTRPDHDDWARPMRWVGDESDDGRHEPEREPLGDGAIAPMGGLWTTLRDLATWVTWLDDAFSARNEPDDGPLSRASRREMQTAQRYIGHRTVAGVRTAHGYGYGLVTVDDADLGHGITHSGGLPGYGSNMRWLPGRRVGVIALANVTYAPMLELSARILGLVADQGLVPADRPRVTTEVDAAAHRLVALLNNWDDGDAVELFTGSLLLDDSLERHAAAAARFTAERGPLTVAAIEATSAAAATVRCTGQSGHGVSITFHLAPRRPPQIQSYTLTAEDPAASDD